jgi:hypothetical protein
VVAIAADTAAAARLVQSGAVAVLNDIRELPAWLAGSGTGWK